MFIVYKTKNVGFIKQKKIKALYQLNVFPVWKDNLKNLGRLIVSF